jgi:hypothetical protein
MHDLLIGRTVVYIAMLIVVLLIAAWAIRRETR